MNNDVRAIYDSLRTKLRIDLLRLDDELIELPNLTMEVAERCARVIAYKDDLEAARAILAAEIDNELRSAGGDKKPTEAQIKAAIQLDARYIDIDKDFMDADFDVARWKALLDAVRVKAHSLRTACELIMAGYISSDSIVKRRKEDLAQHRENRRPKVD